VGFGGALDDRGGIGLGGGERACNRVKDHARPDAFAASLEVADGSAAEVERGGPIAYDEGDGGRPDEVAGAVIAQRGAELAALDQAGAGLAGVGVGGGQADREQAGGDERRVPVWRASSSASLASGTATGASPAST